MKPVCLQATGEVTVQDMDASRYFYGKILGLHELTGDEVPKTLTKLVKEGKVANFVTPDGRVIDLFWEPELSPPDTDPEKSFTRANHLAFDIDPQLFDHAVDFLRQNDVQLATETCDSSDRKRCLFLRSRWFYSRNSLFALDL